MKKLKRKKSTLGEEESKGGEEYLVRLVRLAIFTEP